ncbi:MAG: SH3 domain-containing protein [Lachnospiraceae bacterium]|nr:SH3 domain-containing protein [Lachnospiraceae bacterium]
MNKNQKKTRWSAVILGIAMMVGMILLSPSAKVDSLALGQAKVIPESAKIRDKADLNSNQIGSAEQGKTLDVISQTKGADGKVWYKVYIDGQTTGYIRGDLVNASGTIPEEGAASTQETKPAESQETKPEQSQENQSTTTTASSGNKTTVGSNNTQTSSTTETTQSTEATGNASANVSVSESKVIKAKVNSSSVRVRKGPGTNYDVAGNAPGNTEVSVSGETAGSDGKVWYQVSFNLNNATVNGFIRNDFLEILETMSEEAEAEPVEEEAPAEEIEEEELVTLDNEDYFLKYMQNGEGQMDWFLFDNIKGTSQSLTELLQAAETNTEVDIADADMLSKLKLIVIVMAVVIFLLFIIMTVLLFKLRDASYEEEEEDEEEEEEPVEERRGFRGRRKVREEEPEDEEDEEEEEEEPAAPKRGLFGRKKVVEEEEDEVVVPVKKAGPVVEEDEAGDTGAIDFMDVVDDDMVFDFIDNYKK